MKNPIGLVLFLVLKFYPAGESVKLNSSLIFQALIFSPIIEEIICRKVILETLNDNGYLILGIAISLSIFVILHFEKTFLGNFFFILAGILLIWVQLKTKSLINAVLIHFLINLISILISRDIIKAIKLGDKP
ncbi:CPBP family intramembrane glutamic endopeptidase [Xylocopilactobacillus apis]|uniref:CAAX prenyl protease 2/Lysostaphin resistance protein A-like domain-containing protein n=1 Tax=Xylocopilactobacillus apis TaxID=2932183 RepID=A0AAU9DCZ3_9LACO|nr:CPBP family intramembrane glutamic endopeptidase [Xylocopilactobacillus apis]BDR56011.1 hypothetical protein KIMC2_05730 [Xylocopilactobacillus apis]